MKKKVKTVYEVVDAEDALSHDSNYWYRTKTALSAKAKVSNVPAQYKVVVRKVTVEVMK